MYFVLQIPSLRRLAEVQVVGALWNQGDIMAQIQQVPLSEFDKDFYQARETIEEKVRSNVSALPLPASCKTELLMVVKALGSEICRWRRYHIVEKRIFHTRRFCWTMHGTLDYKKTAELMLKDRSLDLEMRYELACIHCFEKEARESFEIMGEERRLEYASRQRGTMSREHMGLLMFFTCTSFNDHTQHLLTLFSSMQSRGTSVQKILFEYALFDGDLGICEYWYEKLSQSEKAQVLESRNQQITSCRQTRATSLLFYLSRMNEQQQERLFRENTFALLHGFLRWPLQSLFVEAVKCGWKFINEGVCSQLLDANARIVGYDFQLDYDYRPLFWELWRLSPAEYRRHYLNDVSRLQRLFETKDAEFIKLALNRAPSQHLKELVENRYDKISKVLMNKSIISVAALMECKYEAQSVSSKNKEDEEKRLRSQQLSRLVDIVIEGRIQEKLA